MSLLLRIEVIPERASNPLIVEEATADDLFGIVYELERVTGPRLRRRIHESAAANLLRLNPITGQPAED